jgi:hypothetical protein
VKEQHVKPSGADRDPAFDRLIARSLDEGADASGNACPDADLLAAWFDHTVSAAESERIEAHASGCACCQRILADLARSEPEVTRAAPVPAATRPWHWHWRWLVPLATVVVVVAVGTRTLRAPGPVVVPAAPRAALGDRPATWVGLQEAPAQPAAKGVEAPRASSPAGGAPSVGSRAEAELAKAPAPSAEANAPRLRPAAEGLPLPPPAPPPPSAGAVADQADASRRAAVTENVAVTAPIPLGAAARGMAAKPASAVREPAVPLLSTSGAGPGGATVTWRYGEGGVIERSADRGRTWERLASGVTVALLDGSAPDARVCWVVGERGVVLRTTDGRTFARVTPPTPATLVAVHAWSDTSATVTASDRSEYVTTDGGRTWTRRQSGH